MEFIITQKDDSTSYRKPTYQILIEGLSDILYKYYELFTVSSIYKNHRRYIYHRLCNAMEKFCAIFPQNVWPHKVGRIPNSGKLS